MSSTAGAAPGTVERAYQLARSGSCRTVSDVIAQLKQERHEAVEAHLAGRSIRRALRDLCESNSRATEAEQPEARAQSGR